MAKIILGVEGMSCNHCKMAVERELTSLEGVRSAIVSLEDKKVEVEYDENIIKLDQLKQAIEEAGYRAI